MTTRSSDRLASIALLILGILLGTNAQSRAQEPSTTETTAGWAKSPKSPVLGGDLGTCFDISVLKEGDTYRM